jgi:type II secretion system protein N
MKKKLAYTGYIIGVLVLCLYFMFPADDVTAYINYKINAISPNVKWTLQGLKPAFPPGVTLASLEASRGAEKLVRLDKVKLVPSLFSLLTKDKTIRVTGDICDGDMDATVAFSGITASPKIEVHGTFEDVQISQISALKEVKLFQTSGIAAGTVAFSNKEDPAGKGNAQIKITESGIQFTPALFGVGQVTFKNVDADMALAGQTITLKRLDIDGREASGKATGSLTLMRPVEKSRVNITGEVTPHPGMIKQLGTQFPVELMEGMKTKTGGIPFRLSGTLEQPNFMLK